MYFKLAVSIIAVLIFGSSIPEAETFTIGMLMLIGFIVSIAISLAIIALIKEESL